MTVILTFIGVLTVVLHCNGFSIREQADKRVAYQVKTTKTSFAGSACSYTKNKFKIVLEITPRKIRNPFLEMIKHMLQEKEENTANEVMDEFNEHEKSSPKENTDYRKKNRVRTKFRADDDDDSDASLGLPKSTSASEESKDISLEKASSLWKEILNGKPMNINVFAPLYNELTLAASANMPAKPDDRRPWDDIDNASNLLLLNEMEGGRDPKLNYEMTGFLKVISLLTVVLHCNGYFMQKHANRRDAKSVFQLLSGRRLGFPQGSVIIGAPSYPNHLPEAEPILPGHTLIRPALGMLKSSVKFPHRELESGSGVYGNWDNLGIRYDGRNERVLYTGFRRSNSNNIPIIVLFLPSKLRRHKTKTGRDAKNDFFSRIQDLISAGEHRNSKSVFEKGYSSEEIRQPGQANKETALVSLMELISRLQSFKQKGQIQVIKKNPKQWNLNDLLKTNDKYLNRLIESIQRRNKVENKRQKLINEERLNKKFHDQHKDSHNEFKLSNLPSGNNVKELRPIDTESSSAEDINITPKDNIAVTENPTGKTQEERKREWFWNTRDAGNHVKFNPQALDYKELFPKLPGDNEMDDIRSWWYFNQADNKNLHDKRRHHKIYNL